MGRSDADFDSPHGSQPATAGERDPLVEICVDDVGSAISAEIAGAERIELCAALSEGGITPSIGLVRMVLDRVRKIGLQVMIRPRGGDFVVSPEELEVMLADIAAIRALPASAEVGFVFGALTSDRHVDRPTTARLVRACCGAPVTFHKAFDDAHDLGQALEAVVGLGMNRVLTSGGAATALDGAARLEALIRQSAGRVGILAGGGIRAGNVGALLAATGVREVHLRARSAEEIAAFVRASRVHADAAGS